MNFKEEMESLMRSLEKDKERFQKQTSALKGQKVSLEKRLEEETKRNTELQKRINSQQTDMIKAGILSNELREHQSSSKKGKPKFHQQPKILNLEIDLKALMKVKQTNFKKEICIFFI